MYEDNNYESDWYNISAASTPRKSKKKHRKLALILIAILCAVSAVTLAAYGFSSSQSSPSAGEYASGDGYPENWKDYMNQYYSSSSTQESEIGIETTSYSGNFMFSLYDASDTTLSLPEIYNQCISSVVAVKALVADSTSGYFGTGIVLSQDGLIVTNTHIIEGCDTASVILQDGTEYPALLIGADSASDISVLKIEATGLTPATFGNSNSLQVGDDCVAIGNPVSTQLTGTMTNGIISAINRDINISGHTMTLIQTNAAINEGNSGGPLINMAGQVVGITNMKAMSSVTSVEGIGFAIPSTTIQEVVSQLLISGSVTNRPSIGITVGAIDAVIADHYNIPQGLYISAVQKNSDAENQGVKVGDILTAVNDTPVYTTSDVSEIKDSLSVGDPLKLTLWRDGETLEITVTLVEYSQIY